MNEAASPEDIGIVLNGLLEAGDAERETIYRQWANTPACKQAVADIQSCNPEHFYFHLIYPFKQVVEGLLQETIPGQRPAHFLLMNHEFVRAQFRRIIEARDGFGCCADKTRAIMGRLLGFYISGNPITFDAQEEYTFHHPKKVFTSHDAIVEFFDALRHLYAGNPGPYLTALKTIYPPVAEPPSIGATDAAARE